MNEDVDSNQWATRARRFERFGIFKRKTRKQYTSEDKIRSVVSGLRGEDSIADLGISRRARIGRWVAELQLSRKICFPKSGMKRCSEGDYRAPSDLESVI